MYHRPIIHWSTSIRSILLILRVSSLSTFLFILYYYRNISTKVDPCWDISLNLPQGERELSLERCLEGSVSPPSFPSPLYSYRYVCSEVLDSSFPCSRCRSEGLQKQLSFLFVFHLLTLPSLYKLSINHFHSRKTPVICVLHLKRFEHDTHLRKKMTTRVT